MFRSLLAAGAVLTLFTAAARCEEMSATIKKVDAEKNTVTVTIGGDEKTFPVAKDAEIYTQRKGPKNKPPIKDPVSGGLSGLKSGTDVTLTTIKSGEREIVSAIKVEMGRKK